MRNNVGCVASEVCFHQPTGLEVTVPIVFAEFPFAEDELELQQAPHDRSLQSFLAA